MELQVVPVDFTAKATSQSLLPLLIALTVCFLSIIILIFVSEFLLYSSVLVLTLLLYLLLWLLLTPPLQFFLLTLSLCFLPAFCIHQYILQTQQQ
ncbi:E5 [Pygmy chimpanzee papillomavirus type 1]|uniref:Probable protein E5 n=1 Tax=Pygmy chimpanzee papillomavirus type 1 TaxID=10576 RepID=VE5_PCPV1|nr:RecName: Full=Probable protein E5 [Pygmy chimpanzee papillomavirus type 1]pir/W5WLC1/ E5 protein - pygmy chimpanzee papillomavirus (type 1) [Pygmy chimpanzee papillomavirus type 1]CAA44660.1 E5 [Pygmy chimpanzee papillomavirus type 1]